MFAWVCQSAGVELQDSAKRVERFVQELVECQGFAVAAKCSDVVRRKLCGLAVLLKRFVIASERNQRSSQFDAHVRIGGVLFDGLLQLGGSGGALRSLAAQVGGQPLRPAVGGVETEGALEVAQGQLLVAAQQVYVPEVFQGFGIA